MRREENDENPPKACSKGVSWPFALLTDAVRSCIAILSLSLFTPILSSESLLVACPPPPLQVHKEVDGRKTFESYLDSTDALIRALERGTMNEILGKVTIEPYLPSPKYPRPRGKAQTLDWKKIIHALTNERQGIGSISVLDHVFQALRNIDSTTDEFVSEQLISKGEEEQFRRDLRLIMLFHDIGKAVSENHNTTAHELNSYLMILQILNHLGYDPEEIKYYAFFVKFHSALGILATPEMYPDFCGNTDEFIALFKSEHDVMMLTAVNLCDVKRRPWIGDEWSLCLIKQEGELIKEIRGFKSGGDARLGREKLGILMANHRAMAGLFERNRKFLKGMPAERVFLTRSYLYDLMFTLLKKDLTTKMTDENVRYLEERLLSQISVLNNHASKRANPG
jgi:hypothetical protein